MSAHTPGPLVDGDETMAGEWDVAGDDSVTRPLFFDNGAGRPDGAAGYEMLPGRLAPSLRAGPELLEALELVLPLAAEWADGKGSSHPDHEAIAVARAAIAKARGQR